MKHTRAFIQEDMDDTLNVQLTGPLSILLAQVESKKYEIYHIRKGNTINIHEAEKVLFGNLKVDLLFWKDLTGTLKYWVF